MVDFRFLGKEGLMIEYTDIISLVGYNIITYLKSKRISNEKIMGMSDQDILLSYINRSDFDISKWIKDTFDLECNIDDYLESDVAFAPNNLYAYKMFAQSDKENIKNLFIYSNKYSKVIEKYVSAFNISNLKYVHGDLIPILNECPNYTFTTSNPNSIRQCVDVVPPLLITMVDDFMYLSDTLEQKLDDKLRGRNKIVMFTSIASNGI